MKRPEDDHKREICSELQKLEKMGLLSYCSIPNELARTPRIRQIFSKLGLRSGAPDLMVFLPKGLVIQFELKVSPNKQSESQEIWQYRMEKLGHTYYTIRTKTPDEAVKAVLDIIMEALE